MLTRGQQMNILMVTRQISPPWDEGSKNLVWGMANHIEKCNIHLLTTREASIKAKKNITLERIYPSKELSIIQKANLFRRLLKKDPEINIYHFFFHPTYLTSSLSKLILRYKGKASIQTIPSVFKRDSNPRRYILGDKIVVLSNFMKEKLSSEGIDGVVKINPGVDVDIFNPNGNSEDLRKSLGLSDEPIILYAGDYSYNRGIGDILSALPEVLRSTPDLKIIIACRIKNQKDIKIREHFIERLNKLGHLKSVMFLNTVDNIQELINLSDVCIFPAKDMYAKVDIPIILLESLSEEKPIIITDIRPLNEIMVENVGIKIPPGDHEALSSSIIRLIQNTDERRKMGKEGRKMVKKQFNIINMAKQYENLYKELTQL